MTAAWRSQHVLALAVVELDGELIDLTDVAVRQEVEDDHVDLLVANNLSHLDLREITTQLRHVTQTIAGNLYDRGAAAVRFPSRLDGNACVALFEQRATITSVGAVKPLLDPAPAPLVNVCAAWRMQLEPVSTVATVE